MQKILKEEIKLHRKLSRVYEYRYASEFSKMYLDYWNTSMSAFLPYGNHLRVLECGCGTGPYLKDLVIRYERIIGMDASFDMLKKIDIERNKLKVTVGDIENLQFKDNSFDIVICRETLHHVSRPQIAISEISRVMRPGAIFVLSEVCADSLFLKLPRYILYRFSGKFTDNHKTFSSKQLKNYCKKVNLRIEKSRNFGFIGFALCTMPDFLPILKFIPFRKFITRILICIDDFVSRVPIVNRQAFDIIVQARKS